MPGVGSILNRMCLELKNIPMKVFCVMLVILQSFFMDVIMINCYGTGPGDIDVCQYCKNCYWWIVGDVFVVASFIVSFVVSYKHLAYRTKWKRLSPKHIRYGLPLSCVTWFIYSSFVAAKVVMIFASGTDDRLKETDFYGPQFLKTGICLIGVVFILFVASQHDAKENTKERMYINSLASAVTFDVLDTVEFLDVLFVDENSIILPYPLQRIILTIAVINLIRPTFSFVVVMLNHFDATKVSRELSVANALVYVFLVNVPFMSVRMFLWHNMDQDISVFLIKNFIMIFLGVHELHEIAMDKTRELKDAGFELTPRLTTAHRPTDLVDNPNEEVPPTYADSLVEDNASEGEP